MMKIDNTVRLGLTTKIAFLIVALLFVLPGCEQDSTKKKVNTIGIVLFGDSRLPQVSGFKDGLSRLGYKDGESIHYVIRNAKNKRQDLKPLVEELINQGVDMLVAAGGLEADTMKKLVSTNNIPVIVLYVNAIIERGLVESRREPGWSVTGVDNLNAELSGKRVELMKDLLPEMKKILILYYKKIAPSRIGVEKANELATKSNLVIDARAVSSRGEIKTVMENLKQGDVDAMLTVPTAPIDNALKEVILPHVNRLKIPLMVHSRPLAEKGALASYGANFYDLGAQAARLADKVMKGSEAKKLPFETPKIIVYAINQDVMDSMNVQLNSVVKSQVNEFISTK